MRSLRLDPESDARLTRAAAAEGVSVSEFLRRAAAERSDRMLGDNCASAWADVIGAVTGDGKSRARDTGKAFGDLLMERRKRA